MSRYYSQEPSDDAANWEDDEEAKHHKFEQACYNLSLADEYDPTAFHNFLEAIRVMLNHDVVKLEDLLVKAESTHSEKDLAAVGRFLLESSRHWQDECIKDIASGG